MRRSSWSETLDRATEQHRGERTTVEVLGDDLGDQVLAEHMALVSLAYDPKDNVVIVSLGEGGADADPVLRHIVEDPQEVLVDSVPPELPLTAEIVGGDGATTIVSVQRGNDDEQP
jgi:hypothetical protein